MKIFYSLLLFILLVSNVHAQDWNDKTVNNSPPSSSTFMYYNPSTSELNRIYWSNMQSLLGGVGGSGNFLYIGYASDSSGTDYSATFDPDLDYMAFLVSAVEIDPLVVGHFAGLWKRVMGPGSTEATRTLTAAVGNTFVAGEVGILGATGVVKADADAEATVKGLLVMAAEGVTAEASGPFVLRGAVTVTGHGFTVGAPLYVSGTAGAVSETTPSPNTWLRAVGHALDANVIFVDPDVLWFELGD